MTALFTDPIAKNATGQPSLAALEAARPFSERHIGVDDGPDRQQMLELLGYPDLDALIDEAVPASIRSQLALSLPPAATETEVAAELRALADRNTVLTSMIGLGYYDTITPPVIRRNVLESPAWYTAYTPYQPEISQGRLEALLNFQTMVEDLTALPVAGASMLDESTAAAEAMTLSHRSSPAARKGANIFVVDADVLPQTLDVVRTRAVPLGIEIVVWDLDQPDQLLPAGDIFGVLAQYPGASGVVRDLAPLADGRARAWRAAHRGCRPARSDVAHPARRTGRGRRRRHHAAVRRATGLRWPPRRLPGRPCRAGAAAAGPSGRRVGRCRRSAGLSARAADPRAAHPPGEGDQQHLHGPGVAGRDRQHVRRLPRTGRPARDRVARPPAGRHPGRRPARARARRRRSGLLRHAHRLGAGPGRGGRGRRPGQRYRPASCRRRPRRNLRGRGHHPGRPGRGLGRFRACRWAWTTSIVWTPGSPRRSSRSRARRRSCPTRCSPPTTPRRRCCATCAGWPTRTTRSIAA